MIPYVEEKLKEGVCHSLFASGIRSITDEPPACLGEKCSHWFPCVRDNCEALSDLIELEKMETRNEELSSHPDDSERRRNHLSVV